jgi:hypothetical protein
MVIYSFYNISMPQGWVLKGAEEQVFLDRFQSLTRWGK